MGHLMLNVLRRHDRARFTLRAYSIAPRELEDQMTVEFRACCQAFVRLDDIDNLAAARHIAADQLDLLVDLMGHSGSSRPGILLYKPAPVIITHLGSHGPVGLQQVDFKLGDRHIDPPDAGEYQIEAPLALSCCVLPVRRVTPAAPTISREALGLGHGAVVFGVFVSLRKLSPRCLGAVAHNSRPRAAGRAGVLAGARRRTAALPAATAKFRHPERADSLCPADDG